MSRYIKLVLEPSEEIFWEGVISRKILFLKLIFSLVIIFILTILVSNNGLLSFEKTQSLGFISKYINGPSLGYLIFFAGLFLSVIIFLIDYVKVYLITNKRLLVKSGLIGTDFNSIYFNQVRSASVRVDLIDKIFGIGTIGIDTGKIDTIESGVGENKITKTKTSYDYLYHLDNPYKAYKYFQEALANREEGLHSGRADKESGN
jgi:uncharacterized membrane protein YdbT with pleckstrin-like domain